MEETEADFPAMNQAVGTMRLQDEGIPTELGVSPWHVRELGYRLLCDRVQSFLPRWPVRRGMRLIGALAASGFFCRGPGHIQCYCCAGEVHHSPEDTMESWTKTKQAVLTLHAFLFPTCPLVNLIKGPSFIQAVQEVYLPVSADEDQITSGDLLNPPLSIEKASLDILCSYPGVNGVVDSTISLVDQGQCCLVNTVKIDILKRFGVHAGFNMYDLIQYGNDGSYQVMDDKHMILRYSICANCTLQLAPAGSTGNSRGRPLSSRTLLTEYGLRARVTQTPS